MGMVRSTRILIDKYLTRELDLQKELAEREELKEAATKLGADPMVVEPEFNAEQQRFMTLVNAAVKRSLEARAAKEDEADELIEDAFKNGKIFVCHGGPGTGKTTVARACVAETLKSDGRVLFAYPTNRQASRMRAKLPNEVDVDTFHASFGLDSETWSLCSGHRPVRPRRGRRVSPRCRGSTSSTSSSSGMPRRQPPCLGPVGRRAADGRLRRGEAVAQPALETIHLQDQVTQGLPLQRRGVQRGPPRVENIQGRVLLLCGGSRRRRLGRRQ